MKKNFTKGFRNNRKTQKLLLIMKLAAFFLLFSLQVSATVYSQTTKFNFKAKDKQVADVLREIEASSDFRFFYIREQVDVERQVSLRANNSTVEDILNEMFHDHDIEYQVMDDNAIVLRPEQNYYRTKKKRTYQNIVVSGLVSDNSGQPLPGVTVVVKGTTNGTITDVNGKYTLSNVPGNATLMFSFVGMQMQEVAVNSKTVIDLVMQEETIGIDEVVAIGYGYVKKRDLTGSVSSISSKELAAIPVNSPVEALAGKLAGVRITTSEGSPNADIIIRVRGGGSITSDNKPLYIVDGFPVESISDISPSDIETIDVLKDASSTAIYGARGSNGIVLVTTKSGKSGKVVVNYDAYFGVKKAAKMIDVLDPVDYLTWQYELCQLDGQTEAYTDIFGDFEDIQDYADQGVDWQDEVFGRTGTTFNHNLSIRGGTEKMRTSFSYGHVDEKAILKYSKFKRDYFSLKTDWTPTKKLTVSFNARYSKAEVNGDGQSTTTGNPNDSPSDAFGRIIHSVYQCPFDIDNINSEGATIDDLEDYDAEDPLVSLTENYKDSKRLTYTLNGSIQYNITDNLTIKSEWGLDEYRYELWTYQGSTTYESTTYAQTDYRGLPLGIVTDYSRRTTRNTNTVNYVLKDIFNSTSDLSILVGEETIMQESDKKSIRYEGLPEFFTYSETFKFAGEAQYATYNDYYYPDDALLSFFGRVNYSFMDKYLLSGTLRADGSSKFSEDNRWGLFPSGAFAWRLSEEDFFKTSWLTNLKYRLSFGISGNNNIPSGQTSRSYSVAETKSWLHIADSWWTNGTTLANESLKWESTYSWNTGLDFGIFENKLNGNIEFYHNTVHDLLMEQTISGSGYAYQYQNVGKVQNKGFELSLNYSPIQEQDYGLTLGFVISFNKNEIKDLGGNDGYNESAYCFSTEVIGDYVVAPGYSVGTMRGYIEDGYYTTDDFEDYTEESGWVLKEEVADASSIMGTLRPGVMKLKDIANDDNTITDDDNTVIGDANPTHTGGFSISGYARGFDFSANFTWSWGNDIYNADKIQYTSTRGNKFRNMSSKMESGKRWTNMDSEGNIVNDKETLDELNKGADIWSPRLQKAVFSSWAVEDGSFLRLSNLSVGYSLPGSLTERVRISRIRFYATGYNLLCLTNYSGRDPEVDCIRSKLVTPGVDYSAYPKARTFLLGVNVNF